MNYNDLVLNKDIWTIKEVITFSCDFLSKYLTSQSVRIDVELILAYVLGCNRIDLYLKYDQPLSVNERNKFKELLFKRALKEPVAYIIGKKFFWEDVFYINPSVMIPRDETEVLVENVLNYVKKNYKSDVKVNILDIGTGSGCVGISLAKNLENINVVAVDIDNQALEVAEFNARMLNVLDRMDFIVFDALNNQEWIKLNLKFDIIVSNPPYIPWYQKDKLSQEVVKYEPHIALFANDNGLAFYKSFAQNAPYVLKKQGGLFVEFGVDQNIDELSAIFLNTNYWNQNSINFYKDISKNYRVLQIHVK